MFNNYLLWSEVINHEGEPVGSSGCANVSVPEVRDALWKAIDAIKDALTDMGSRMVVDHWFIYRDLAGDFSVMVTAGLLDVDVLHEAESVDGLDHDGAHTWALAGFGWNEQGVFLTDPQVGSWMWPTEDYAPPMPYLRFSPVPEDVEEVARAITRALKD